MTICYYGAIFKEVKNIGGSRNVASFKSTDKTFQFPGAFEQGFLLLDE